MPPEESDEEDGGTGIRRRELVEVDEELESLAVAASCRFLTSASDLLLLLNWWERGNLGLPLPFCVFVCL
jgi:hypothetical protein